MRLFGWKAIQNAMGGLPQRVILYMMEEEGLPIIPMKGTVTTRTEWLDYWWTQQLKRQVKSRLVDAFMRKAGARLSEAELQALEMYQTAAEMKRRGLWTLPKEKWRKVGENKKERLRKLLNDLKPHPALAEAEFRRQAESTRPDSEPATGRSSRK